MKKGVGIFICLFFGIFLSISFISAGWWGDFWGEITGQTITGNVGYTSCTDQTCDNNPANGIVDTGEQCSGTFKTWYQDFGYTNLTWTNNWAYFRDEWIASVGNNWYWAQGNCSAGLYPRYLFINMTTGWTWADINCSQNGSNYCIPPVPTQNCIDSDGGLDYYVNGETRLQDLEGNILDIKTDYCNGRRLYERFCTSNDAIGISQYDCEWCNSGACLTNLDYNCIDTDNGSNVYAFGTISGRDGVSTEQQYVEMEDFCVSSTSLTEGFCENNLVYFTSTFCLSGCVDGVCLPDEPPEPVPQTRKYKLMLVTVSDTSATIKVSDEYGDIEVIEIEEGTSNIVNGIKIRVNSAEEVDTQYSADISIEALVLSSLVPEIDIEESYTIYLVSASDTSATIKVTDTQGSEVMEINENSRNIIQGLEIGVDVADEANLEYSASLSVRGITLSGNVSNPPTCTPQYYCTTNPTICPADGKQTKTCEDVECNAPDYTETISCNPGQCSGCEFNERCIPYGFRTRVDLFNNYPGTYNLYCDIDGLLKEQKVYSADYSVECQNNYECESNLCSSGSCVDVAGLARESGIFKRILCRISSWLGIESYESCISG